MFDAITLDQLRVFLKVVEEGSFSAAGRRLRRAQSAISAAIANLEGQLGLVLWDRSTRIPRLTEQGKAVLVAVRRVASEVDALKGLSSSMASGVEPSVSLCVDALLPGPALVDLCGGFAREFPSVDLRVDTEVLSVVSKRVLDGSATIGVVSPPGLAPGLERKVLAAIRMIPVAAPTHPLASLRGPIPTARLATFVQIVLSERGSEGVPDQAVLSPRTWRVGDLHTKHALLRAGLGWGNLPEHLARSDLRGRRLVALRPEAWSPNDEKVYLSAIYRPGTVSGPAHRWILAELSKSCARATGRK